MTADVVMDNITLTKATWVAGQKPTVEDLSITGKSLRIKNPQLNLLHSSFLLLTGSHLFSAS